MEVVAQLPGGGGGDEPEAPKPRILGFALPKGNIHRGPWRARRLGCLDLHFLVRAKEQGSGLVALFVEMQLPARLKTSAGHFVRNVTGEIHAHLGLETVYELDEMTLKGRFELSATEIDDHSRLVWPTSFEAITLAPPLTVSPLPEGRWSCKVVLTSVAIDTGTLVKELLTDATFAADQVFNNEVYIQELKRIQLENMKMLSLLARGIEEEE